MSWQHIPMRRTARALTQEQCLALLRQSEWGVLGLAAPVELYEEWHGARLNTPASGALPYAVPLNYALRETNFEKALVFHGALQGLKMNILSVCPHACFTVVPSAQSDPERLTTHYKSVIVFGQMRRLEGQERADALLLLGNRFCNDFPQQREETLRRYDAKTAAFCLDIEGITGKYNSGKA